MKDPNIPPTVGQREDGSGGTPTEGEKEILKDLFFDEPAFVNRLKDTVQRARKFLQIDPQTGRVVLTPEARAMRVQDQIRALTTGRYFAWRYGVIKGPNMDYKEIAAVLSRPPNGISPELSELVRNGDLVREEDGSVSMPFHRIDVVLAELEQSKAFVAAASEEPPPEPVRRTNHRASRQKADPVVQGMLEKSVDLSAYSWVRNLKLARDKGLMGLLIAKDDYGVDEMTCSQLETFLTRKFPVRVTRAALGMAFLVIKSQYIDAAQHGNEIAYTLLPYGREYILGVAREAQQPRSSEEADNGESEKPGTA
jgi:hypothetical protein